MKKVFVVVLMVLVSCSAGASGTVKKGQTFTAKEDVVYFNLEELNLFKSKIDSAEKNEKLVVEYKGLVEDYKRMREIHEKMISEYSLLDQKKNEAIGLYKESLQEYKGVVESLKGMNEKLTKYTESEKRRSKVRENLKFFFGFVAPILGARAIQMVK